MGRHLLLDEEELDLRLEEGEQGRIHSLEEVLALLLLHLGVVALRLFVIFRLMKTKYKYIKHFALCIIII